MFFNSIFFLSANQNSSNMPTDMVKTPSEILAFELQQEKKLCSRPPTPYVVRKIVRTPITVPTLHYSWNGTFTTYHVEPNPFFDPVKDTHWYPCNNVVLIVE
jgi:hypothetical protein